MKINVISINRQHLLDLARSLYENDCDVEFYTSVPAKRCKRFGLSKVCCKSYFYRLLPYIVLDRICKRNHKYSLQEKFAQMVMQHMRPCDVAIINGYGACFSVEDYKEIQQRGTKVVMEWGSKHIYEQCRITNRLESYPKDLFNLHCALYDVADVVSIPARHVKESFLKQGIPAMKLFTNPYGVNIDMFPPTRLDNYSYDLIMVGAWRDLKGTDYIVDLCLTYGYSFLHVGSIGDKPFPKDIPNMKHVDAVNEYELPKYYAKGKVFILPSKTEGFGLVLGQAIACGLPVVCSCNTGGEDLGNLLELTGKSVFVFSDYSLESIKKCIDQAFYYAENEGKARHIPNEIKERLSWKRYGRTYKDFLKELMKRDSAK